MASPCIILQVEAPTTGTMGPRVRIESAWAKSKNIFRVTRVVPLLVSPPLLMVTSMLGSVTSLHQCGSCFVHRVASFIYIVKIINFKKKIVSETTLSFCGCPRRRENPARGTRGTRGSQL